MRNLFLALVVANLGFAAWHSWFAESLEGRLQETEAPRRADAAVRGDAAAPTGPSARADGSDPLLTAETAAAEAASEDAPAAGERSLDAPAPAGLVFAEAQATVDPQVDTRRCVSVGPFQAAALVSAAMDALRTAGHAPAQRDAEGEAIVDYWVHLAGVASRAEANVMLGRLRANGVADAYLIPGEEDGDIISLGVFRQTSRAGRLQDEVRQIGYESSVAELTRRPTVHWIDVPLEPDGRLDAVEDLLTSGGNARLEQQPCPSVLP